MGVPRTTSVCIELSRPFRLDWTVRSHGWVQLSPWRWNPESGELSRPEKLASGERTEISVRQTAPDRLLVRWSPASLQDAPPEQQVVGRVQRWLSLDWDPETAIGVAEGLDPVVAGYIRAGGGRFLRGSTLYEDLVKTICTINASWPYTRQMIERLVALVGDGVFPAPTAVVAGGAEFLRVHGRVGFRAAVIEQVTAELLRRGWIDEQGHALASPTAEELMSLRGLGPYAASHMRVLLRDYSHLPVDSEVRRYCRENLGLKADEIDRYYDAWGEYRFLGYKLARVIRRDGWTG